MRLLRGDFDQETIYGSDPVAVAHAWQAGGARMLHVVDLDGARLGSPQQLGLVRAIAAVMPVELGGGLRTPADVAAAFEAGVQRVVLGTAALDQALVRSLTAEYGDRIVIALDTRAGQVTVAGWMEASEWTLIELAEALIAAGAGRFLHTDVERDGTMTAPNYASLAALVALGKPVIASGGISSLADIDRLRVAGAEAAIVGRALYERAFRLEEALTHAG